jgi:camphor 5-monooxygenase
VNFLTFMMLHLARHPEIVKELQTDKLKLMRSAEEMFRRFPITQQGRMVAKDQAFRGVDLRAGDMVLLPTVLHSIDDSLNPDPLKLDPNRKSPSHSTFGAGKHRCAGMHLARMEVIATLEEWFKRIPEFGLREGTRPIFKASITANVSNIQLVWNR